jgi:hypothetical protein
VQVVECLPIKTADIGDRALLPSYQSAIENDLVAASEPKK